MRLLHSHTLQLYEFFHPNIPPYAILSHRWDSQEISFQDMNIINGDPGYAKILACCQQAVKDGLNFVWVDTCCIDKSSSSELSEAINSMYQWYKSSSICYAYLSDFAGPHYKGDGDWDLASLDQFMNSRWFKRGWTLQELIAPRNLRFYSAFWISFGVKAPFCRPFAGDPPLERSLAAEISKITTIDVDTLLTGLQPFESIAKKMSWAAKRTTTRIEDVAYSLLGIFGVNMPLLYGEGHGAFFRLQTEIMKISDDQSIFAWALEPEQDQTCASTGTCSLLAESPSAFAGSGELYPFRQSILDKRSPHQMTSRGVRLELELRYESSKSLHCLGLLACGSPHTNSQVAIHLQIFSETQPDSDVVNAHWPAINSLLNVKSAARLRRETRLVIFDSDMAKRYPHKIETAIYVAHSLPMEDISSVSSPKSTVFFSLTQGDQKYRIVKGWPRWNPVLVAIEELWTHSGSELSQFGAVWFESELTSCRSFVVLVQAINREDGEGGQSISVITDTENPKSTIDNMMPSERHAMIDRLQRRFQNSRPVSSADCKVGPRVYAETILHPYSRRNLLVRINIRER